MRYLVVNLPETPTVSIDIELIETLANENNISLEEICVFPLHVRLRFSHNRTRVDAALVLSELAISRVPEELLRSLVLSAATQIQESYS